MVAEAKLKKNSKKRHVAFLESFENDAPKVLIRAVFSILSVATVIFEESPCFFLSVNYYGR